MKLGSKLQIIGIAVLVLLLSIGAPNQPGSILIGMLIITYYLQANDLILCRSLFRRSPERDQRGR